MFPVGHTTMYENACCDTGWVERPTSCPLPGVMNREAYGSRDDGMQRTAIFVTMTSFSMESGAVQASRVGTHHPQPIAVGLHRRLFEFRFALLRTPGLLAHQSDDSRILFGIWSFSIVCDLELAI